jgi:O-antigen ligase
MTTWVGPLRGEGIVVRPAPEGLYGLLLVAMLLVSTVDDALAPVARGFVLACFPLLTVVNAGAAVGVYIAAALVFSVQYAGQGSLSWVQRPDNFALLFLTFYLLVGRCFGRSVGAFGSTAVAVALLLVTASIQLVSIVGLDTLILNWFARMFVIPLGLFVLLRRVALSPSELRALFLVVAVMGIYIAAMSVFEVFGWHSLVVPPWLRDNHPFGTGRAGGLAMQPEWNAIDISLAFCVLLLLRLNRDQATGGVGWLAGCGLCLLAIYFTYTRGAWLGLVVGGVPLFWQMSAARGVTVRRRALFVASALGFTALAVFFPTDILQARTSDADTVYFRFNLWVAGLRLAAEHPLLGVGFGQFSSHVGSYVRELGWIPPMTGPGQEFGGNLAHNTLVSVAAELGLLGLTLYVFIISGVYRAARAAAGTAWGQPGRSWVAGFTLVYHTNVQFITAHWLTSNLLYFGIMGAIAGVRGLRVMVPPSGVSPARMGGLPGELPSDRPGPGSHNAVRPVP